MATTAPSNGTNTIVLSFANSPIAKQAVAIHPSRSSRLHNKNESGTSTPMGAATTDEQRYPRGARDTNQPKLEVTSVKMISSSCQ